jgi:hypothetical protein
MMFGISLISLFGYHIYLTCSNRSTLGKYIIEGEGDGDEGWGSLFFVFCDWACD